MADRLDGCRVAILVTDGFEEVELTRPRQALDDAGAETSIVSPKDGTVRSWRFTDWGQDFPVDVRLSDARPEDFDALLLPGGRLGSDRLRCFRSRLSRKTSSLLSALFAEIAAQRTSNPSDRSSGGAPAGPSLPAIIAR